MRKFEIIYADPPWQYRDKKLNRGGAARHYNTMDTEAIKQMKVQTITADNAALFLWATFPQIKAALEVIEAWGFTYKTAAFVWIKKNKKAGSLFVGMGNYTRANAEICLLGIKGKPERMAANIHQVIIAPVREHSRKPDEVRERIVELMGDRPRIELFARETAPGWESYGDETTKFNKEGGTNDAT